ncbi:hypothetical protein THTE_1814 [Thermogutta terrifontis]|jgi:hypothetical protein|uniref:Uncharacterized protein n=1 Tax=Thermogutta terrifontis TaxID=1331910 RepID=A0A286REM9_9BACT|nr:hypothetical protein [Thermogutta terrifontis]ASV74416.1 hypothetical protein THTE_1814 [Thermogutta terrifontis]
MNPDAISPDSAISQPSEEGPVQVFVDRRKNPHGAPPDGRERRQFGNSYADLSPEARELGQAIDAYKLRHHRRFINYEELLAVIKSLGYHK